MSNQLSGLRRGFIGAAIAFGVTLAIVIGLRLDQGALATVVGVACGIGSSIPMGILIVLLLRRRGQVHSRRETATRSVSTPSVPPVVIVAPPTPPQLPNPATWPEVYTRAVTSGREFKVIGGDELESGIDD